MNKLTWTELSSFVISNIFLDVTEQVPSNIATKSV